jgi:predicted DNA-binding transcriptional regulator YafY
MMIKFEFGGPSVQAVLDKLPTARIVEVKDGKSIIEAEVYGDGIKMFLLSQGSWVRVIAPKSLADDLKNEALKILEKYK